jgi:phage baseplate assembly protein V
MGLERKSPFRVGIVKAQDLTLGRVRVAFPDLDQMTSWWLALVVPKTQNDKACWMPDIGEQVVCLMDENLEDGAVLGAVYSDADSTPVQSADKFHLSFKDGASFEYDRAAHALAVALPAGATVTISASGASISIDADGNLSVVAPGRIKLGSGGLAGVARLGDQVTCPAGTGTITSASTNVMAD